MISGALSASLTWTSPCVIASHAPSKQPSLNQKHLKFPAPLPSPRSHPARQRAAPLPAQQNAHSAGPAISWPDGQASRPAGRGTSKALLSSSSLVIWPLPNSSKSL